MKFLQPICYLLFCVVCFIAACYTSVFGVVFIILASAAIAVLSTRNHYLWSLGAACLAAAVIYLLGFSLKTIAVTVPGSLFAGCFIAFAYRKKLSTRNTILAGSLGFLLQVVLVYAAELVLSDYNFIANAIYSMRDSLIYELYNLPQAMQGLGGEISPELLNNMAQLYNQVFDAILVISPSLIVLYCGIFGYISILISKKVLMKRQDMSQLSAFCEFHAPLYLLGIFLVFALVGGFGSGNSQWSGLASNICILLASYIAVCGLATIDFFARKKFKKTWQRLAFYIPAFFLLSGTSIAFPFINPCILLFFAGMIDCVFDFRKFRKPKIME